MSKYIPDDTAQGRWQQRLVSTSEIPYANHQHLKKIWHNPLNSNSLRLTKAGFEWAITCTKNQPYKFSLDTPITNRMLLQLDRCFTGPYYLTNRLNILVLDEKDAIMLQLCGSNLAMYLDNLDSSD